MPGGKLCVIMLVLLSFQGLGETEIFKLKRTDCSLKLSALGKAFIEIASRVGMNKIAPQPKLRGIK